jgi:hypothetical protein
MLFILNYGTFLMLLIIIPAIVVLQWTLKGKFNNKWYGFVVALPALIVPAIGIAVGHYRSRQVVMEQLGEKEKL